MIGVNSRQNFIMSTLSCLFLLYTFTVLDFLSFGTKLINPTTHGVNIENFNMLVFTFTTVVAQLLFGIFTGLKSGICGGPIVESQFIAQQIHKEVESLTSNVEECLANVYICLFISTMLFALISFVFGKYGVGKALKYIPKTALYGVMCTIGISLIKGGIKEIYRTKEYSLHLHISLGTSILITLVAYYLEKVFSAHAFFIPGYCIAIVVLFHGIFFLADKDLSFLRQYDLLPASQRVDISFKVFADNIDLTKLKFSILLQCLPSIIKLAFFNLIHITVNVPGYVSQVGIKCDLNQEFKTQAISNFATAFTGFPSYFICSTSIFFNRSGGRSKFQAIIGGILLTSLIYVGPKAREFLPCILLSFIPLYIGASFILSNFFDFIGIISKLDLSVILFSAFIGTFYDDPIIGLILGSSINAFIVLYSYYARVVLGKNASSNKIIDNEVDYEVIKINYMSFFMTSDLFKNQLNTKGDKVIVDLTKCPYLDMDSNIMLEKFAEGKDIKIIGNPYNFYINRFKDYL